MKYGVIVDYNGDKTKIDQLAAIHHDYFSQFLQNGSLFAAGRRADHAGAMWVVEVETPEQIEKMVQDDPLKEAGVITGFRIYPMSNWSSKAYKGR